MEEIYPVHMWPGKPRDSTGYLPYPASLSNWSPSCGNFPFLDIKDFKSIFVEKLFFLLVDNKVS